jgi:hypothetical protein
MPLPIRFIIALACMTVSTHAHITVVVIDLPSLFERYERYMAGDIGYGTALKNLLRASKAPARVFEFIQTAFPEHVCNISACDPSSKLPLPGIMQDLLTGKVSGSYLANEGPRRIEKLTGFESDSERDFIMQIVRCMYTPSILCKIFSPLKERIDALKEIRKKYRGVSLVMACNFDTESYALLRKLHGDTLDIFDQHFVSGHLGMLIQDPIFWQNLLQNLINKSATAANVLVITCDEQTANICTTLGLHVLHVSAHTADGQFTKNTLKKLL